VADKAAMRGWLQTAADLGVTPDVVIPDHLLLAPPGDGAARIAPLGPMAVVRAADLAVTCEPDLAPLILGDRRVERVEDEQAAQALFAAGVADPIVNLLQGEFAMRAPVKLDAKALRGPVLLALAALAVPVLADGVAFVRHTVAATRAEALTASTAAAIAPEVAAAGGDVRAAALARAAETTATGSGGFLAGAAALFAAVEASPSMQLVSLLYSADGSLRATVRYADLAAVEGLRAALSDRGYLMEEGGSTATDGATLTEITMRPGR
jgi:general secretion pathway protein L